MEKFEETYGGGDIKKLPDAPDLRRCLLRRRKEQVLQLPPRSDFTIRVPPTKLQLEWCVCMCVCFSVR